jgi:hypothetical protein
MNLALVTSYIIAAMLILSIMMMNLRMSSSSTELTLTQLTRQHVVTVADMLNDDIPNMGYNVFEKTDPILRYAHTHRIRFDRNIEDDPNRQPETITWEFDNSPIMPDKNANIGLLMRIVNDPNSGTVDTTKIRTGVTRFRLRYYDQAGKDLNDNMSPPGAGSNLVNVKQIYLELEMQSIEPIYTRSNSDGRYIRSVYEKRFSPRNLE